MSCGWRSAAALAALGGLVAALADPPAAAAQQVRELGVQALVTAGDPTLATAGLYAALRTSSRTRFAVTASAGSLGGRAAIRGELLGHFLLAPTLTRGTGLYVGGGLAAVAGPLTRGYAVLLLGAEGRPGGSNGWSAEVGIGGGVRVTAGWRWRRHGRR